MVVTVNFRRETWDEPALSIAEIMRRKNYSFPQIITTLNGTVIPREARETAIVRDGDELELFHLTAGG